MRRPRTGAAWIVLAAWAVVSVAAAQSPPAQQPRPQMLPRPESEPPPVMRMVDPHAMFDIQRRLQELDQLLSVRSLSQAQANLTDLEQHTELAGELLPRRIRLHQLMGEFGKAAGLARQGLVTRPDDPILWRYLGISMLALANPDSARLAWDQFLTHSQDERSAGTVAVDQCLRANRPLMAADLIDTLRIVLNEPRYASLPLSQALLALGRKPEAAVEISASLRAQPYNLSVVRSRILQGQYDPQKDAAFLKDLTTIAESPGAVAAEQLLVANLLLAGGESDKAVAMVTGLIDSPRGATTLLQNTNTLTAELEIIPHDQQYQATIRYLMDVLSRLASSARQRLLMRQRAADKLSEVCERALVAGSLGDDPQAAVDRFTQVLEQVRTINPSSERLYSAQIKLAEYLKDTLKKPELAARNMEHLLMDTDLPTEGVALTRLTLGECYLAAGDTARGRVVLTQLGRDPEFHEAAGYAHYHLAKLDLAEGGYMTARDRFAVVALDNPGAPYANDALELGLAVAEELDNSSGGPEILGFYAPCILYDVLDQPAQRLQALRTFVKETRRRVDLTEPQHLLEKGMFELAGALADADSLEAAREVLRTLYTDHPDSRYAPRAMDQDGRLLMRQGREDDAQDIWTRLLAQYPDYIFLPDVRDELKELS